ncbi:MAG: DNA primase [Ignavibacteriales bacterium]
MRGGFDHLLIDEVRAHTDIVEVISRYVSLKKAGKYYMGLCPFHLEKTPSFAVSPERQVFHCFGCQTGGDVFAFLMKRENISFPEAVRELAERAGIRIPEAREDPEDSKRRAQKESVLHTLEWATSFFQRALERPEGGRAREYIQGRGVTPDLAQRFRLGFAPAEWDALGTAARKEGIPQETLVAAGLVNLREQGGGQSSGFYDRFRGRLMFPVCDHRGRVLGFGARSIEGVTPEGRDGAPAPKYVNSPETPVYTKGRVWYAMHLAKEAIRVRNQAVVVEGYMDAITCHGHGVSNVIASCGTALTQEQVQALAPLGCEIVVSYDSDSAGTAATLRSLEILRSAGCRVRVAQVPEGKDPDDFVREGGGERFQKVITAAKPVVDYVFDRAVAELGTADPVAKGAVVEKVAPFLWSISNEVEQSSYVSRISEALRVPADSIWAVVKKKATASQNEMERHKNTLRLHTIDRKKSVENLVQDGSRDGVTPAVLKAEESLVRMMLSGVPDEMARSLKPEYFSGSVYGRLARHLLGLMAECGSPEVGRLMDRLEDEELVNAAASLALKEDVQGDKLRVFRDCVLSLKKRRLEALSEMISNCDTQDREQRVDLMREMQGLLSEVKGSA